MASFYLVNFGCRASQADGAALKRQLLDQGLEEVSDLRRSSVAVLNTCTVTAAADREVRQVVRRLHRANPNCSILVTGCYAQRAPQEIAQLPGVKWVVGNSHKHGIREILRDALRGPEGPAETSPPFAQGPAALLHIQPASPTGDSPASGAVAHPDGSPASPKILVGEVEDEFHFQPVFADDRTRPTLKIQDGCNARCSFCVIPFVRGRSRSLEPGRVISQVRDLERAGCQEVVLSGINLGSYARDLGRRITFLGLLERILAETSIPRLRISSIEPMDVGPELISLVAGEPRMAQHFHIPLQSGCDRILRLMNRRYWASQYAGRIQAIRGRIPACGIGADVMAGFPDETDRDHAESLTFIESLPFTYLHIFPYSPRPGTRAAAVPNPPDVRRVQERCREIRTVIARKRQAFLESQIGKTLSVLTLHESDQGARLAVSSNYLRTAIPRSSIPGNVMVDVRVERLHEGLLFGPSLSANPWPSASAHVRAGA